MEKSRAKNILLVDDQKNFLTILATELRESSNNFFVLTAKNGEEALRVLESDWVDLIVTDLKMPVMNGYDLISHMNKKYPGIPVIVISSFLHAESETQLKALGVSQYIDKQFFSVSALEEMIIKNWQGV
jgi:CheY-like chemotaxis protein